MILHFPQFQGKFPAAELIDRINGTAPRPLTSLRNVQELSGEGTSDVSP
jgi:hypothetical protein